MYNNTHDTNEKIYTKMFKVNPEEKPVLASLAERCPPDEVDWGGKPQEIWNVKVAESIAAIANVNPYLPDLKPGEDILAVEAASHPPGFRGVDCRPKVFDAKSKSWKMCDTGSMITVIKKSQDDKIDKTRVLKAVNGSSIACYGQKEIEIKIGRKPYRIKAVIADTSQDIIGWDYFKKHKLSLKWGDFGDLYI